jgi:hypothetical protein
MSCYSSRWIKKTRKPHSCLWCDKRIETGSAAYHASGVFEGDFWSGHHHPECAAAIDSQTWQERQDGYSPGECARGRTDDDRESGPAFSAEYRGANLEAFRIPQPIPEEKP